MVQEEDYHGSYIKKNQMVSYLKELLFIYSQICNEVGCVSVCHKKLPATVYHCWTAGELTPKILPLKLW